MIMMTHSGDNACVFIAEDKVDGGIAVHGEFFNE